MNIAKFSVRNPVLVNLLMIGLFIYGGVSLFQMPTELNPEVEFNWVFINVIYTGASPNEIENLIIDPIESEIQDVDDIDEIQSTAGEGIGFIMVKFKDMSQSEFRERYVDLKAEIDKVNLPEEVEDPFIDSFNSGDFVPVITVNMSHTIPEENAYHIADELSDDIEDIPGVAKVQVSGLAEREIWVEVNPEVINSFGITFNEIVMSLMSRNINIPGGTISFGKTEYFIRALGEYKSVKEIEETIVRKLPDNTFIKIKDIAAVKDRREEMVILSRLNLEPSITFSISKTSDANSIDVIDEIKSLVDSYQEKSPEGITFSYSNDNSVWIMRVIRVLRNNAVVGMLLIILVLYFFLGFSNAALASLGIPISFFITFIFMNISGYTLNGSTLFALVMVLGIIVDDAIIVIENCHRHRLRGLSSHESAIIGTREVAAPIISSILTNVAAFLPLMLLPGIMGKFLRIIPIIFSMALLASLFEAFFLLPSHYADWTIKSKIYKKGEKKFFIKLRKSYGHLLIRILRKRYWIVGGLILILFLSMGIIPLVGVEMFGEEDFDVFWVMLKMPEGTSLEETDRIVNKFEKEALSLPRDQITNIISNVGLLQGNEEWLTRKNVAQLFVELKPQEERTMSIDEIISLLRDKTTLISGPISVEFEKVSGGPPVGKPITIRVQGKYYDDIKKAALVLEDSLRLIEGTKDIVDNSPPGKQEIRINIDEEKAALYGFSIQDIALNVRSAFDGIKATEYRDADDEIDVIIRYNEPYRSKMDDVLNIKIVNTIGQSVALRNMVSFDIEKGDVEIRRFDQKRTILVTGDIDESKITMDKVNNRIQALIPKIREQYPEIDFAFGGEFEEFQNTFADITSLFMLGLILIFLILGTQFRSYIQPLIILTAVPFSLIGAVIGLVVSNNPFSIVSMYGFVALAGIVVNDAIVMISFMNDRRSGTDTTGFQYWRSIVNSGRLRLRPIILTSLTTISGLVPMAFGIGGRSDMWSPLANVILFGLLVSTLLTLFVIPCFLAIVDDIKGSRTQAQQIHLLDSDHIPYISH
ncbi:MAG: efflux RND transporter permease subunit [Calditrichaceae bacterium]|nr:efflux RND transporter permease subunit [Calditrichaceae bacterium]